MRRAALYMKPQTDKRRPPQDHSSASNKAPTRLGCGFKADQMALNLVLKFSTPFLWMQDRPYDEDCIPDEKFSRSPMREEMKFDKEYRTGRSKFGVEYGIPLPWPQDRPPDNKLLQSPMRDETRLDKEYRAGRAKFGVEYGIPSPGRRTAL